MLEIRDGGQVKDAHVMSQKVELSVEEAAGFGISLGVGASFDQRIVSLRIIDAVDGLCARDAVRGKRR